MAWLRNLAVSLLCVDGQASIAAADRRQARDRQPTLTLLQTAWAAVPCPGRRACRGRGSAGGRAGRAAGGAGQRRSGPGQRTDCSGLRWTMCLCLRQMLSHAAGSGRYWDPGPKTWEPAGPGDHEDKRAGS
jgi:hypothetical protein